MHLVLYTPEIPPNTGNVARLCAATRTPLHLVEPLGFSLEDRYLRRAGLDYWPHVDKAVWPDLASYLAAYPGAVVLVSVADPKQPKVVALGKIPGEEGKSPEGITHFEVNGEHYLLTANEMSGTVACFKITKEAKSPVLKDAGNEH